MKRLVLSNVTLEIVTNSNPAKISFECAPDCFLRSPNVEPGNLLKNILLSNTYNSYKGKGKSPFKCMSVTLFLFLNRWCFIR